MAALTLNLIKLTKPRIMLLVMAAGVSALILERSMLSYPVRFLIFMLGLYFTGGCANALNQLFEKDIDSKMHRTRGKRPLPLGKLSSSQALVFSILIGAAGVAILSVAFNLLTGFLSLMTILFYGFVYTLWLKPYTGQNIVIGGIAGAMAPVGAWAAATGTMGLMPWLIFSVIFLWTPPHFWSLALCFKDDYEKTDLPMMPLVAGDDKTLDLILIYSLLTVAATILTLAVRFSCAYFVIITIFGTMFVYKSFIARKLKGREHYWSLFRFSILYLFAVLLAFSLIDLV